MHYDFKTHLGRSGRISYHAFWQSASNIHHCISNRRTLHFGSGQKVFKKVQEIFELLPTAKLTQRIFMLCLQNWLFSGSVILRSLIDLICTPQRSILLALQYRGQLTKIILTELFQFWYLDGIFKTVTGGTFDVKTEVLKASTEIHWFGELTTTQHLFYKNIPTINVPFLGSWSYRAGVFPPTVPLQEFECVPANCQQP